MATVSIRPTAVKYGLILGGILAVYSVVVNLTGQYTNNVLSWLPLLLSIGVSAWACVEYRNQQGFMKFGQGFGTVFLVVLISSAILAAATSVQLALSPNLGPTIFDASMEEMRQQSEENINKAIAKAEKRGEPLDASQIDMMETQMSQMQTMMEPGFRFTTTPVGSAVAGIGGGLLLGVIAGLIVAAILKRDPAPGADMDEIGG